MLTTPLILLSVLITKRRFKSQVQHICSQLKKLGVFIESLDFFNSQLESTQ